MTVFLRVVGEQIFTADYINYNIKQPSRKVFNSDWSKVGEYQHEIANHFRDYNYRKKINRNFKRKPNYAKIIFKEQEYVYRDILPLNRIDFPEPNSGAYHNLFKHCYENTLRKISSTNSVSELEFLTKRQERLYKHKKVPSFTQGPVNHCSNNLISTPKKRYKNKTEKRNLQHIGSTETKSTRSEHNQCVNDICDNKVIWEGVSVDKSTQQQEFSGDIDTCFFRLASECYDEGFLSHIKYLKSIADRNATNYTSKRRNLRYSIENTKSNSQPLAAATNVSSSSSVEDLSNSVCVGRFASIVKRLLGNRICKQNLCNNCQQELKICVNITNSGSFESLNSNRSSGQKPQVLTRVNCCIMSDFLNAAEAVSREIVDTNSSTSSTIKRQHFHDLIENLNKLEINESCLLPKITISSADDTVKSSLFGSESSDRTFLKQDSLEIDIPFFNGYYSSEARPP